MIPVPALLAVPSRVMDACPQSILVGVWMEAVGTLAVFCTMTEAVEEQPLFVLVTDKMYVPAAFTIGVNELTPLTIPGPVQA